MPLSLLLIIQAIVLPFSFSLLQSLVYLDTILPSINSSGDISDKYLPYHLSVFLLMALLKVIGENIIYLELESKC